MASSRKIIQSRFSGELVDKRETALQAEEDCSEETEGCVMWGVLIGLIERWWREKPRKDVVQAVVHLRDEMIRCQSWYVRYQEALNAGDLASLYPNPRVEWTRSLADLTEKVADLDDVLSIFSPEAHAAIASYIKQESLEMSAMGLVVAAEALQQPLEIDISKATMAANFPETLNQLREFIAANFKPDEIFKASSSRQW